MSAALALTREQILAFRRAAGGLNTRAPDNRVRATRAGLQDSMPRAALLSLHARTAGVGPEALSDPALVQVWGPRYSVYVIAAADHPVFTLGRLPDAPAARDRAERIAAAAAAHVARGGSLEDARELRAVLGTHPNALRYATTTGTLQVSWDGARSPTVRIVPRPDVDPAGAQRELARRYLEILGPGTAGGFADWAGIAPRAGAATFAALDGELTPVRTPTGDAYLLTADLPALTNLTEAPAPARLLPSGDAYWLLQSAVDRALLVPDPARRASLWTPRVWPGALLIDGEITGTWRRSTHLLEVSPWRRLTRAQKDAASAEAAALPLPGLTRAVELRWMT